MTAVVFLSRKLVLFALLSVTDFLLTWKLLQHTGGLVQAYESNPLASWCLAAHGWLGLAAFKGCMVCLVSTLCVVIAAYRPRTGARVLQFACLALASVSIYSGYLCKVMAGQPAEPLRGASGIVTLYQPDAQLVHKRQEYRDLRDRLIDDLIAGRCTLAEAVNQLAHSEQGSDPHWLETLRVSYEGRSDQECLAANIMQCALVSRYEDDPLTARLARRFEAQFRLTYGTSAPSAFEPATRPAHGLVY
jgi:hypothetical protein